MPVTKQSQLKSPVKKRSVNLKGHRTSISIEDAFWAALKEIAALQATTVAELVFRIDQLQNNSNLSSALRLHVLAYYVKRSVAPLEAEPTNLTNPSASSRIFQ